MSSCYTCAYLFADDTLGWDGTYSHYCATYNSALRLEGTTPQRLLTCNRYSSVPPQTTQPLPSPLICARYCPNLRMYYYANGEIGSFYCLAFTPTALKEFVGNKLLGVPIRHYTCVANSKCTGCGALKKTGFNNTFVYTCTNWAATLKLKNGVVQPCADCTYPTPYSNRNKNSSTCGFCYSRRTHPRWKGREYCILYDTVLRGSGLDTHKCKTCWEDENYPLSYPYYREEEEELAPTRPRTRPSTTETSLDKGVANLKEFYTTYAKEADSPNDTKTTQPAQNTQPKPEAIMLTTVPSITIDMDEESEVCVFLNNTAITTTATATTKDDEDNDV